MTNKMMKKNAGSNEIVPIPESGETEDEEVMVTGKKKKVTVLDHIINAIEKLDEKKGTSLAAIKKYVRDNYDKEIDKTRIDAIVLRTIKKGVQDEKIIATPQNALRFKIPVSKKKAEKKSKKPLTKKKESLAVTEEKKEEKVKKKIAKDKSVTGKKTEPKSKVEKKSKPKLVKGKKTIAVSETDPTNDVAANATDNAVAANATDNSAAESDEESDTNKAMDIDLKPTKKGKLKNGKVQMKGTTKVVLSRISLSKKEEAQIRRSTVVRLPKKMKTSKPLPSTMTNLNEKAQGKKTTTRTKPIKTKKEPE